MKVKAEDREAHVALAEALTKSGQSLATAFRLEGPEMLTALISDSKKEIFKKIAFKGGEEFVFDSVRIGKKNQMIFCFRSMEASNFKSIEIEEPKAFETFPLLTDLFAPYPAFKFDSLYYSEFCDGRYEYFGSWYNAQAAEEKAERERIKAEKRAEQRPYENNDLFGMF